jgi:hypothetical protein
MVTLTGSPAMAGDGVNRIEVTAQDNTSGADVVDAIEEPVGIRQPTNIAPRISEARSVM